MPDRQRSARRSWSSAAALRRHFWQPPSSTWLGWGSLLAVGAVSEIDGEDSLEFFEDAVKTQPAPAAFGRVSRNWVMKRWAAVTRVMWWCQPA
jgi:hypothetical protein